jgi:D-galactarolactone cycloisomerase
MEQGVMNSEVGAQADVSADMRIREVEAWVIKSQIPPMVLGGGHSAPVTPDSVLVRITTEDGHTGFGDSWVQQTDARILRAGVMYGVRPHLLGQDSRNIAALWRRQWQAVRNHGLHPAVSATDIALWDLRGRVLGQPVSGLLGGPLRSRVEAYATIPWHRPAEEQVRLIEATSARGFRGVKVAVGHGVDEDRQRIVTLREAHPDVLLAIDANGGYDVTDALRVGTTCDELDVRWFEEPVPYTNPQGLAAVGRRLRTPVSGFQSDTTVYALRRYLDIDALSIFQPSLDKCGGITQAQRIGAVLDAWGKRLVPHSAAPPLSFLAALHVSATAPTGGLMEFMVPERDPADPGAYRLGADHLRDASILSIDREGFVRVPDAPGLGMEIDMDAVAELQRRD